MDMIQILKNNGDLKTRLIEIHRATYFTDILNKLNTLKRKKNIESGVKDHISTIQTNLEKILCGDPDELLRTCKLLLTEIEKFNQEEADQFEISIKRDLEGIFNYNDFRDDLEKEWNAYALMQKLNVTVCPYCNREYTFTIVSSDDDTNGNISRRRTRPEIDHFLPRKRYPHFGLSLFNMIPSCHVCNSNLKRQHDTLNFPIFHPYSASFHDFAQFTVQPSQDGLVSLNSNVRFVEYMNDPEGNSESFSIKLELRALRQSKDYDILVQQSTKLFALNELYDLHKDYASEIITKAMQESDDFFQSLSDVHPIFKADPYLLRRFWYGNYSDTKFINKRPLSKLTIDLIEQFGLSDLE